MSQEGPILFRLKTYLPPFSQLFDILSSLFTMNVVCLDILLLLVPDANIVATIL